MPIKKTEYAISGIRTYVYCSASDATPRLNSLPVAILFVLHGRGGSYERMEQLIERLLGVQEAQQEQAKRELIVVAFDHRNHGGRLVDPVGNLGWDLENLDKHNPRHAIDMYAIQTGTAKDVSLLIDFLPAYLFPHNERTIDRWMVLGKSLGGHSTWIALRNDPRVTIGIPIIACPDYLALMLDRARKFNIATQPPFFPASLLDYVAKHDPISTAYTSVSPEENQFYGKKVFAVSGGKDPKVPWVHSERFFGELEVGEGTKDLFIDPEAGHEMTTAMVDAIAKWLWKNALGREGQASL